MFPNSRQKYMDLKKKKKEEEEHSWTSTPMRTDAERMLKVETRMKKGLQRSLATLSLRRCKKQVEKPGGYRLTRRTARKTVMMLLLVRWFDFTCVVAFLAGIRLAPKLCDQPLQSQTSFNRKFTTACCKVVFTTDVDHELQVCNHDLATPIISHKLTNNDGFSTDMLACWASCSHIFVPFLFQPMFYYLMMSWSESHNLNRMSLLLTYDAGRAGLVNNPIFFTVSSAGDLAVGFLNESSRLKSDVRFLPIHPISAGSHGQSPDLQNEAIRTKFRHLVVNTSQIPYERLIINNRTLITLVKTGYRLLGHLPSLPWGQPQFRVPLDSPLAVHVNTSWATPSRYYVPLQVDPPSKSKTRPRHRKRP
ncbi:hypothetical protein M9H77_08324 [Catharanthus roseus]|uniref:Uncharacterized protein n=1 Tax=Catharanthus roseus TaxID=4058 RepID=A0ACC0BXF3_CATRO|nr:hypothetical protein M9H77_08324 [Catharanthus roseus]